MRTEAMRTLASFAQAEALPSLRELAKDKDPRVRAAAVEPLAKFSSAEDLPLLRELAGDGDRTYALRR